MHKKVSFFILLIWDNSQIAALGYMENMVCRHQIKLNLFIHMVLQISLNKQFLICKDSKIIETNFMQKNGKKRGKTFKKNMSGIQEEFTGGCERKKI